MKKEDMVATFKGKPINEMTREELIEALNTMARLYNRNLEQHIKELDNIVGLGRYVK
jgi:hypothetical protein